MHRRLPAAVALLALILACGGRSVTNGEGGEGGSAGSAQGTSGSGGSAATAGSGATGGACACPDVDCVPGYVAVPKPDDCCFTCEPLCNAPCPTLGCGPGMLPRQLPGECCPQCFYDTCESQQASYQAIRNELLEKYASAGCMTDADCSLYSEHNGCWSGCPEIVPTAQLPSLDMNLRSLAEEICSPGCPILIPPCLPQASPVCLQGRCVPVR